MLQSCEGKNDEKQEEVAQYKELWSKVMKEELQSKLVYISSQELCTTGEKYDRWRMARWEKSDCNGHQKSSHQHMDGKFENIWRIAVW